MLRTKEPKARSSIIVLAFSAYCLLFGIIGNLSATCVTPPAGLIGWWRAEGNTADATGTNSGALIGGAGFGTGEVGRAFMFPTTGAAVRIPASSTLNVGAGNGFTIECWVNPNDLTKRSPIAEWNNGATYGVHLQILGPDEFGLGAGNLFADVHGADGRLGWIMAPGGTLVSNVWQHIALTYSKTTGIAQLIRNGVVVAQTTFGSYSPETSYDFYIGYRPAGGGNVSFSGLIDELSLYSRSLALSEVQSIYQANSVGKCFGPKGPPIITQFSPLAAQVDATVSILGDNFGPTPQDNIVYFGAVRAAVTSAGPGALQVVVPAGSTYAPITVTVGGLTAYAPEKFLPTFQGAGLGLTNVSFATRQDITVDSGPYRTAIGDLDGDGKPDLIVAHVFAGNVWVYRNVGTNGTLAPESFASPVILSIGSGPVTITGLALADLDGDGRLDVVVANWDHNDVSVYQNLCSPGNLTTNSFGARIDLPVGISPLDIAVADIDGDGKPDIAVPNYGSQTVSLIQNIGSPGLLSSSSFSPAIALPGTATPHGVALADIDGDGKTDLIITAGSAGSDLTSIYRNVGGPGTITINSFAPRVDLQGSGEMVLVGDLDGDGKPDLVTGSYEKRVLSVFHNNSIPGEIGTNSFGARVDLAAGGSVHHVALGDLDGDGKPDIALVTEGPSQLDVFRNISSVGVLATNSFAPSLHLTSGQDAIGVSIGDLNGDGQPDIAFANQFSQSISLYQNLVQLAERPVITAQPTNQTASIGDAIAFSVLASGTAPLSYQWRLGGTNLAGATSNILNLVNIQSTNAGNYSVLVSNLAGFVLSSNALLTVTLPPTPCTAPPAGLVGWWKGDSAPVDSVSTNAAVLLNGAGYGPGEVGQAFVFTTTNAAVRVPASTALNVGAGPGFTIECWVNPTDLTKRDQLIEWNDGTNYGTHLQVLGPTEFGLGAGNLFADIHGVDGRLGWIMAPGGTLQSNVWQHVALTYNKTNGLAQLFRNGQVVAQATLGSYTPQTTYDLYIGRRPAGGGEVSFSGSMDEVSIYSRALSPAELLSIYVAGSGGKCMPTVAPFITDQPSSQSVLAGGTVNFSVAAGGNSPLSYQWRFNGTSIDGATASSFVLTNAQVSSAGNYSVLVTNTFGFALSSNAVLTVNFPIASISVVNQDVLAGHTVAVPVVLAANGNENGVGFTLTFDPALLSFQGVTATSNLTLSANTSQAASGKIGVLVARQPGTTFEPGPQELIQVTFAASLVGSATSAAVGFGNSPLPEQLSDIFGNGLPYQFVGGQVSIGAVQFEADVSPRPNGDGAVKLYDWVLVGRYAARLDYPTNNSEFQRADCAPRATLGDGAIDITDWVQAGRYAAGLDPLAAAGGPTNEIFTPLVAPKAAPRGAGGNASLVRASAPLWLKGQTATLSIYLDAQGTENALGFGLQYDPNALSFVGAALGASGTGGILNVNTNQTPSGKLGFGLALGAGSKFSAGTHEVIRVQFKVASTAPANVAATFIDQPMSRQVADVQAAVLSSSFANASIVIQPPPSLSVLNAGGSIILTWPAWATNFVLQETSSELNSNSWSTIEANSSTNGNGAATVTLPTDNTRKFYRLYKP